MNAPWECAGSDRLRYLQWVLEVSQLPWVFVALGECRDAYRLKLARSWESRMGAWCLHQCWLQERGNPNAWELNVPTREAWLRRWHRTATEDDIEDGTDLLMEIRYHGIGCVESEVYRA